MSRCVGSDCKFAKSKSVQPVQQRKVGSNNKSIRFILMTSYKCPHCINLKNKIQNLIDDGIIENYDLNKIPEDSPIMDLFEQVSPNGVVPVLVYQNGVQKNVYLGEDKILKFINTTNALVM